MTDSHLAPFVPRIASEWDSSSTCASWQPVTGSLLFVDISGFTHLSERLAEKGRIGAEELTSVLNRVFGRMLDAVFARGGSLLKFGGDALLLMFESEDSVMQACTAAVEMRTVLRDASKEPTSVGRINLKMSSGVHTGEADFFLVGKSHRELIITGPTASTTTEMEAAADAGEIVVSETVRALVPKDFIGERKGGGWLLRKQKIAHPLPGVSTRPDRTNAELSVLVPAALRDHLIAGIGESEHRMATVGFVKFKGIDRLLAEQGPERVGEALDRLVSAVQDAADDESITFLASDIDTDGGKLILAAGVPASQPDDEGRMLRAARRIVDAGLDLEVRIGVNRGHVFAGDVGNEFRRTYTVMGDTVNLAARLMAAAQPGTVYSSPSALDLSSTLFRTEALEPFHVKGKDKPVLAYDVYEEKGIRTQEARHELPFAGREPELQMIVAVVTTCAQVGTGGMMTITGDTGLGKSRLIAEVLGGCPGLATLMVQAEPNGVHSAYWAFRDPLRNMLGVTRGPQAEMVPALSKAIRRLCPDLQWALPLFGSVTQIDVPDNEHTVDIDPRFRPDRIADVVIDLLSKINTGPFAALAEDGHWMDESSIALLRRLGQAAETRPWTVIFTARRERTQFDPLGDEVVLRPLSDDAVRSIALQATAAAPLRPHVLAAVVARAGGNPLFLSEILKMIRETGNVDQLPESLDAVVSYEIDTLRPLTRQLLRYSSVLGRSFRRVVLDELLAAAGIAIDDATEKELGRFIDADGAERLRFRHAVAHDVAYEGLSYRRRRELHATAGDVIERLAGDDPAAVAESLATHFSLAATYDKAWHYSRMAADKAKAAYANTDAATHYRNAIDAVGHLENVGSEEVAEIWTRLGEVQDLAGLYEAARDAYSRALRSVGDDRVPAAEILLRRARAWFSSGNLSQAKRALTMGRKKLGPTELKAEAGALARLEAYEASIHAAAGNPVKALAVATAAVERARSSDEEEALARAYGILDWANFALGRQEPRNGREAIKIYQRLGFIERSVGVMNNMGAFAYLEGRWDEAVGWYRESLDAAERSGNVSEAAVTRANIAEVLVGQRKYEEAVSFLEQARRILEASKAPHYLPFVGLQESRARLGLGEVDRAVEQLTGLLEAQLGGSGTAWTAETAVSLGDALVQAGNPGAALEVIQRYEHHVDDAVIRSTPGLARIRGYACSSQGDGAAAVEVFDSGLASAIESNNLYEERLIRQARVALADGAGTDPDPGDVARLQALGELLGVAANQPA